MEPNNNFLPQNNPQGNPPVPPVNPGFIPKADPTPVAPQPAPAPEPTAAPVPASFIPPSPVVSAPAPVESEPVPSSHIALWILALVITAIAFGAIGYFVPRFGQAPVPTPATVATSTETLVATSTTDWKTYSNPEYGFNFQYPADFVATYHHPESGESFSSPTMGDFNIYVFGPQSSRDINFAMKGEVVQTFTISGKSGKVINLSSEHFTTSSFGGKSAFIDLDPEHTIELTFGPSDIGDFDNLVYNDEVREKIIQSFKFSR